MRKENTKPESDHAVDVQRVVKRHVPKCQWMCERKNWEDCGRKATHRDPGSHLTYCRRHASIPAAWLTGLVPLNSEVSNAPGAALKPKE